jgi:outer membrane protein assembly factor BamB
MRIRRRRSALGSAGALALATSLIASAAPFAVASTGAGPRTAWPQYQGDAGHTGWDRGEAVLNPSNAGSLTVAWSVFSESFIPVEANGLLFHIPNVPDRIDAVDAATGAMVWRSAAQTSGNLGVAGSVVYSVQPNDVVALDAATGVTLWTTPTQQELDAPPVVAGGALYEISSGLTTVYAIDTATGAIRWSLPLPDEPASIPAVAGGRIYVEGSSSLFALDPSDSHTLWQVPIQAALLSGPVADAQAVYVVGTDGAIHAFEPGTGAEDWHSAKRGYTVAAATATRVIAVAGAAGRVASIDARTGAERWSTLIRSEQFSNPPVVGGGVVFVMGDDGRIVALRASDGMHLHLQIRTSGRGTLALVGGRLYAQDATTALFAFGLPQR